MVGCTIWRCGKRALAADLSIALRHRNRGILLLRLLLCIALLLVHLLRLLLGSVLKLLLLLLGTGLLLLGLLLLLRLGILIARPENRAK